MLRRRAGARSLLCPFFSRAVGRSRSGSASAARRARGRARRTSHTGDRQRRETTKARHHAATLRFGSGEVEHPERAADGRRIDGGRASGGAAHDGVECVVDAHDAAPVHAPGVGDDGRDLGALPLAVDVDCPRREQAAQTEPEHAAPTTANASGNRTKRPKNDAEPPLEGRARRRLRVVVDRQDGGVEEVPGRSSGRLPARSMPFAVGEGVVDAVHPPVVDPGARRFDQAGPSPSAVTARRSQQQCRPRTGRPRR